MVLISITLVVVAIVIAISGVVQIFESNWEKHWFQIKLKVVLSAGALLLAILVYSAWVQL